MGPNEGSEDPSWWLTISRTDAPIGPWQDVIFEIARVATYSSRSSAPDDGVMFGLRMVKADGTPNSLDFPRLAGFISAKDSASLDAILSAFEHLPYADLLCKQGWLDILDK